MTKTELITLKMNILGGMHEYIKNINDEDCYMTWVTVGVPDESTEDDLEYIATNHEEFGSVCLLFGRLVSNYVKADGDEYTT